MNRAPWARIALYLLAGALTPVLAGVLAWGYVDAQARQGLVGFWLYRLPMLTPEPWTLRTGQGYMVIALGYAVLYAALGAVARFGAARFSRWMRAAAGRGPR